jgi:hypothetical protein
VEAEDLVAYESVFAPAFFAREDAVSVLIDGRGAVLAVNGPNTPGAGQTLLCGRGTPAGALARRAQGDSVDFFQTMGKEADQAVHVLGAGPRLLEGGVIVVDGNPEGFPPDIMNGRAPRSAVGLDGQGGAVLFVADGRAAGSAGLTLYELARELAAAGVADAINLDGGGSSEMVIGSQVMNEPSDRQGERKISAALGVFAR